MLPPVILTLSHRYPSSQAVEQRKQPAVTQPRNRCAGLLRSSRHPPHLKPLAHPTLLPTSPLPVIQRTQSQFLPVTIISIPITIIIAIACCCCSLACCCLLYPSPSSSIFSSSPKSSAHPYLTYLIPIHPSSIATLVDVYSFHPLDNILEPSRRQESTYRGLACLVTRADSNWSEGHNLLVLLVLRPTTCPQLES